MPEKNYFESDIDADRLRRAFLARIQAAAANLEELAEEYRIDTVKTMMAVGISLIPSDHLLDNQFVVSRKMYEAAKRLK